MTTERRGGSRKGSGRKSINPILKKKGYKIYINDLLKSEIDHFGNGNSFSEKTLSLINLALDIRKENLK